MPLPNPNSQAMNPDEYQKWTAKEAIKTAFSASLLQMQSNIFARSPILRSIPGTGILAERAEVKKRELYERSGRDEQGRKLTKQEIEDRQKRRQDLGALAYIRDIFEKWQDQGFISVKVVGRGGLAGSAGQTISGGGMSVIEKNADTTPYPMQEELSEEKLREEEEMQKESEKRQQSFFVGKFLNELKNLLGGGKKAEGESPTSEKGGGIGGILSTLANLKSLGILGLAGKLGRGALGLGGRLLGGAGRILAPVGAALMNTGIGKTISSVGGEIAQAGRGAFGLATKAGGAVMGAAKSAGGFVVDAAKSVGGKAFGAAKSVGGKALEFAGKMLPKGGGGGWLSKAWGAVSNVASKLNPLKTLANAVKTGAPKILKALTSVPGIGAAIEIALGSLDISSIKKNPDMTPDEKKHEIGKRIGSILGGAIGTIGGGVLGSLLPIPGIGTIAGSMGGGWLGGTLGELLAETVGPKGIYDFVESIPLVGNLVRLSEDEKSAKDAQGNTEGDVQRQVDEQSKLNSGMESNIDETISRKMGGIQPNQSETLLAKAQGMERSVVGAENISPAVAPVGTGVAQQAMLNQSLRDSPTIQAVNTNNTNIKNTNQVTTVAPITATRTGNDLQSYLMYERSLMFG